MKNIDLKNVSSGTIARTLFLFVSLVNSALGMFGFTSLDIDENTIYTVVTGVTTIVSAVLAFWKNNSFTKEAIEADKYRENLLTDEKIEETSKEEIELEEVK
ncbi:phage holin [Anaerofustis butyriciformans]|uniref:phage holin n=1 Tax=Anaerofustis butyriciformans TaxID=3108533 RepID=UPI002E31A457|nr:phage holin [Anaerofustis sp. HA2171]